MFNKIQPILDHVVINVADSLDTASEIYGRLGFGLTDRGHHTLGSSNNLAVFDTNYLELLGYLPGRQQKRADLWGHPLGLTGLVFKAPDPERVYETVGRSGVPVLEPLHFARPVALPEGAQDAKFTVVRLGADVIPNGRAFFCHHETPHLVWRPEWRVHPNGVESIAEFVIVARDPAAASAVYGRIFGSDLIQIRRDGVQFAAGTVTITIHTPESAALRFGDELPALPEDGSARMAALILATRSLHAAGDALKAGGVSGRPFEGGLLVAASQAANLAVAFRS